MRDSFLEQAVFHISSEEEFNAVALDVFRFQYNHCGVYSEYVNALNRTVEAITHYSQIPFLPISFFKLRTVVSDTIPEHPVVFESSGTTGDIASRHVVTHPELYERSFIAGFNQFYGNPEQYIILALLPNYLERENSSLVYMAERLIKDSRNQESGFFLHEFQKLYECIQRNQDTKILLLGVSFALLDFAEQFTVSHPDLIVMETGGMKGRRKEVTRDYIHSVLKQSFGVSAIHSEYGMTELLSQAYSFGNGVFETPAWMKVLIRDTYDPFSYLEQNQRGGVNVIDLANLYSCSFIETQDIGKDIDMNRFVIEGRFDASDVRGCNLMYR